MKTFLTTLKGKIIAGVSTAVVAGGIVAAVIIANSGFRTIVVNAFNGVTTIVNGSKTSEAYEGLHLKAGDDVTVGSSADLTLAMDEDKHVYAEPNTHFWVEAKGKLGNTKTKVYMDEGSNLFRIDDKLSESEYFEVDTPNSTMSVRGTVFRVTCYTDENGEFYTDVEVYEGEVFVQAKFKDDKKAEDNRIFRGGERVTVHLNKDETVSEFMTSDNGYKMNEEVYRSLPQGTVKFLGRAAEDGRILCITKDLLFDYAELSPHKWEEKIIKEPTAEQEGELIQVCAVCGKEDKEVKKIPKIEDEDKDSDEDVDEADPTDELEETDETNDEARHAGVHAVAAQVPAAPQLTPEQIAAVNAEILRIEQENCDHTYVVTSESSHEIVYTCSKCGRVKTKEKKSDDDDDEPAGCQHVWVYRNLGIIDRSSDTPTATHKHERTCRICGKSETDVITIPINQEGPECPNCGVVPD